MNIEDIKKGMRVKCTDVGTMTRGVTSESKIDNYVVSELIRNTPPLHESGGSVFCCGES